MSLYSLNEANLLDKYVDDLIKKSNLARRNAIEPTEDKQWDMLNIVYNFVKEKKRKIYGGFALNKLIALKDEKDKFYDDCDIESWDIDFYSPDPIEDAKEIANRLHKKGYKYILASEAQHEETYKVHAESLSVADISYVPTIIYNNMPFKEIEGAYVTGPTFMMIDYFRVLTDPLTSWHRLDKTFKRLSLMLKHYPLPTNSSPINTLESNTEFDLIFKNIHSFLTNRPSTIVVGMYPYNHLVKQSGMKDDSINYISANFYEFISTEYKLDTKELITLLKEKVPDSSSIKYVENYPLFQYLGYSTDIYFKNELVCKIYHYNYRCTPYFDVPADYFENEKIIESKKKRTIRIGTVSVLMMYNLIAILKAKIDKNNILKSTYYQMISHIIKMKNYYLKKNNKTIFDDSLFQEFIVKCIGDMETPQMERQKRIARKIKSGKKFCYNYNPEKDMGKDQSKYFFKNTSGNKITNKKNLKINFDRIDLDDDNDEDE